MRCSKPLRLAQIGLHATQLPRMPNRLILCFDGTGNVFSGERGDTNVVKIYKRLDRSDPNQFHYYQPGIGTYVENESSGLLTYWNALKSRVSRTLDQGMGTTFRHHVIAGYQFLMRYYTDGDEIYIFGFSRGAYTARFLAQMVSDIGLLSRGNEEMVRFAWDAFSQYQQTYDEKDPRNKSKASEASAKHDKYRKSFRDTFCRKKCKVHFLGLFDCVNSVKQFEVPFGNVSYKHMPKLPATHVRHAVSIHERRAKFKPALFDAELNQDDLRHADAGSSVKHSVKEVWFAGNHGDVGGGWEPAGIDGGKQRKQLSDLALDWMLNEITTHKDEATGHSLQHQHSYPSFLSYEHMASKNIIEPSEPRGTDDAGKPNTTLNKNDFTAVMQPGAPATPIQTHDMLKWGRGSSLLKLCLWWFIEYLPFKHLELIGGSWQYEFSANRGATRDIPRIDETSPSSYTRFHPSVQKLADIGVVDREAIDAQISTVETNHKGHAHANEGVVPVKTLKAGAHGRKTKIEERPLLDSGYGS